jgi:RNA polymerase sigma-70 factor, ECF subfamily
MAGVTDPLRTYLAAAAEGDNVALGELVRQTQPAVWRMCSALGSLGDVEDLVQETYLRALKSLGQFRGDAAVQTWFLSIARNVCADQVRRQQRQRRLVQRITRYADQTPLGLPDHSVEALLFDVPFDRREAFVLTQVLGLSYDEASEVVGCPVGTIRSRVSRAKADMLDMVLSAEAR